MSRRILSTLMKAIRIEKFGGPEVLTLESGVPVPKPKDTEVLIRGHSAGVNPVDTYIRQGNYALLPDLPYTPGKDGAGIVEEVGSRVANIKKGDRVYNIFSSSGTYAQYHTADEKYVFRLHDCMDYHQGAALGVPYATAYRALVTRSRAKAGQTVLVHGASGAVGLASCQIARALGLTVLGTAGSAEGMNLVRDNGAQLTFNHREENYVEKIKEATKGVDIVLEMLANVNLAIDCTLCKYQGTIAVIGSRDALDFAPRLMMGKELNLHGVGLMTGSKEDMQETEAFLYSGQALGWVKPVVGKVYSLEDVAQAHRDVIDHSGGSQGKIILNIP